MSQKARLQHGFVSPRSVQERILEALEGLRFGAVEIQVYDFRIVKITRTEKVRLDTSDTYETDNDQD